MRCKHCSTRNNERTTRSRRTWRSRVAVCARCGAPILALTPLGVGESDGTLAQLARFGLAITGAPLLEPNPEASEQCAGS